jgi:hypothetical protein
MTRTTAVWMHSHTWNLQGWQHGQIYSSWPPDTTRLSGLLQRIEESYMAFRKSKG